ncbi:MAG: transcriptional repressor [Clostridiales bacterium]|nr:transcriptional repressor [Clostridiales bacterium]
MLKENLEKELKSRNIKLSYQRLKVLEYLVENQCHPTADEIYTHLQKSISTLSKTTVYNTLNLLIKLGLVRVITIDGHEARYEIEIGNHGHFKCESCGAIFDFSIDIDSITSGDLSDFKINNKKVYFKGLCPGCLSKTYEDK